MCMILFDTRCWTRQKLTDNYRIVWLVHRTFVRQLYYEFEKHLTFDRYVWKQFIFIHSVSKEMHHKFIGFPWNPGSRSGDPGRVVYSTKFIYLHSSAKETQLSMVHFIFKIYIQDCQRFLMKGRSEGAKGYETGPHK